MAEESKNLNIEDLEEVAGGKHSSSNKKWKTVRGIKSGTYLAVRTRPAYNPDNELGKLYNNDSVEVTGDTVYTGNSYDPYYTWIWSPRLGLSGYVNSRFIG